MSIEAMRQALEALQGGYGDTKSWHKAIESAIKALRTAIQQAEAQQPDNAACKSVQKRLEAQQPSTPEPVGEPFCFASVNKHGDVTSTHKRRDSWRTIPLYTHPAPGGLGDSKRLDYLQDRGATIDLIAGVAAFYPMRFRVGGLHSSANIDVRAAIDAAMLTTTQVQKGQG